MFSNGLLISEFTKGDLCLKISKKMFVMVLNSKMPKSLIVGRSFCIFTPRVAKCIFSAFLTYVNLFEPGNQWIIVQHMEYLYPRCKSLKLRANPTLSAFFLKFFNVCSALPVFFNISNTVESHIYQLSLNNLHHHMSKWLGSSEKQTPSIVRFDEK